MWRHLIIILLTKGSNNRHSWLSLIATIAIFLSLGQFCFANENTPGELDFIMSSNPIMQNGKHSGDDSKQFGIHSIFTAPIKFYQKFISTQDRPVCNFTPSCSQFGIDSIRKCGIIKGILLTSDRLQRCNGMSVPYYILDYRTGKFIDPVQNYTSLTKKQTQK